MVEQVLTYYGVKLVLTLSKVVQVMIQLMLLMTITLKLQAV